MSEANLLFRDALATIVLGAVADSLHIYVALLVSYHAPPMF